MKKFALGFFLLMIACAAFAQKPASNSPEFDITDFNRKFEVAQWLVEYDNVAWKTTDVLLQQDKKELERLGQEWFCFKDKDGTWHAVYGKLSDAGYETVFHFVMDPTGKITRSDTKLEKDFLDRHARALSAGRTKLMTVIPADSPRFNQYIRQNSDKTLSVWLFPAFQPNRVAVYGGEAIYTLNASGQKIVKDESYFQPNLRGFKSEPPREIWLNYSEMKKPPLGAVFFVWYYRSYFTKIFIENEKSTSTALKTENGYVWVHLEKEIETKPKTN